MSESIEVGRLFAEYASGEISAEQLQTLEAALRADAELRGEFIEYLNVDSALGDLAALSKAELAEIEATDNEDASQPNAAGDSVSPAPSFIERIRNYRVPLIAGAVAATVLLTIFLSMNDPGANTRTPVATLVSGVNASLTHDGESCSDTDLAAGKYQLQRGLLHLSFGGGVTVYVEAPASFDAVNDSRVVLHNGRLSASVPHEGIGFTVETPEAEVVDFGTEFSVDVEAGTSEVHVFDGLVRVQPRAKKGGALAEPVDLRTAQAVKIEGKAEKPVEIELATDRFIRTFDEPKYKYPRAIKRLSPIAYYRMPIRDRGLAAEPPQYSGVVLTGDGRRPPHARGVSNGGSLRVLADSTGRGGRVDTPLPLRTGQFTLAGFVYLENPAPNGTVATNIQGDQGNFSLSLDERGFLMASIRTNEGELISVSADSAFPFQTWRHLIMTVDGEELQIYEDGQLVASSPCSRIAGNETDPIWIGTDAAGFRLWNGRIDELALFDRALSAEEIADLLPAALEEMATTE